jgi:hypothetical protein
MCRGVDFHPGTPFLQHTLCAMFLPFVGAISVATILL